MERVTKILPTYQVAKIQRTHNDYNVQLVGLGIVTLEKAQVTLEGWPEDIDKLLIATDSDVEE